MRKVIYILLFWLLFFDSYAQKRIPLFGLLKPHPPSSSVIYGCRIRGSTANEITAINAMGATSLRPLGVQLSTYTAGTVLTELTTIFNAGLLNVVNLNWINSPGQGDPDPFCQDTVAYEIKLRLFLNNYANVIYVAVIENEPTNGTYYVGSMLDYVKILKVAVRVCHEYNVTVADGSTNIALIDQVRRGSLGQSNARRTDTLLGAYVTIPLDFINFHTVGDGNTYPFNQIPVNVSYAVARCGHPGITNEWHTENGTVNLITSMVQQWQQSGVSINMGFDGSGLGTSGNGDPWTNGSGVLTTLGIAFRDAIAN